MKSLLMLMLSLTVLSRKVSIRTHTVDDPLSECYKEECSKINDDCDQDPSC
jgi:hypothetical protein